MQEKIFAVAHLADQSVLYLLLILCLMSLYMIIDRYWNLQKIVKDCREFKTQVSPLISNFNQAHLARLIEFRTDCKSEIQPLANQALRLCISHVDKMGLSGVDALIESFKSLNRSHLEKYLGFLATVGSNAPYIGLFGTVLGIMKSFNDMAAVSAQAGQGSVMAGISSALIATAAGLLAAIPAVLSYNFFQKQVKLIFETIDLAKNLVEIYAADKVKNKATGE